jgi:NUMOD4 motif/NUMOD1 domain
MENTISVTLSILRKINVLKNKKKIDYPYQNLELANLKGEEWEEVPGFEGEYEVSNLGRVKSLSRWRLAGPSGGYYTKEIIRRQGERKGYNNFIKEKTFTIGIALKHDGISTSTSTARYVYYAFVKPFDLENKEIVISYKDSDGRNLHYKNLFLTDRSKLAKRTAQLNRTHPPVDKMPVNQYTLDGKLITRYESITAASKVTGFHITGIMSAMLHNIYQHKGYRWEYAEEIFSKKKIPEVEIAVFNDYLWEMLGKPKTSTMNPIPVLNLSKKDLPGEKWKEIEGFGGNYLISNLGRIKSISRLSDGKVSIWKKGVIKKLLADNKKGEKPSCLLCTFSNKGKKFQLSMGRMMYYHFIRKFKLADRKIKISYKDGCCYNLSINNLILVAAER